MMKYNFQMLFTVMALVMLVVLSGCAGKQNNLTNSEYLSSAQNSGDTLTRQEIQAFTHHIKEITDSGDVEQLRPFFTPAAIVRMTMGNKSKEVKADQYVDMTKHGMRMATRYSYKVNIDDIEINRNRAVVHSTINEVMDVGRRTLYSTTKEELRLEKQNGQLRIHRIEGESSVESTAG